MRPGTGSRTNGYKTHGNALSPLVNQILKGAASSDNLNDGT
jgi:hypothetical protein